MGLTPEEKAAGRRFRTMVQHVVIAEFDRDPPVFRVPNFLAVYRHPCPGRGMRSTALELREVYRLSPADADVPAGRFGFITRAGTCRSCGATAASRAGRLVDAHERPPIATAQVIHPIGHGRGTSQGEAPHGGTQEGPGSG